MQLGEIILSSCGNTYDLCIEVAATTQYCLAS